MLNVINLLSPQNFKVNKNKLIALKINIMLKNNEDTAENNTKVLNNFNHTTMVTFNVYVRWSTYILKLRLHDSSTCKHLY